MPDRPPISSSSRGRTQSSRSGAIRPASSGRRKPPPRTQRERRRRLLIPLGVIALLVLVLLGALIFGGGDNGKSIAKKYGAAYARGDYGTMYGLLSADSRQRISLTKFASVQQADRATATATAMVIGPPKSGKDHTQVLPVTVRSSLFGRLNSTLTLPIESSSGHQGVQWSDALAFPGLHAGETLRRTTQMPDRAALLARDGTTLASGTPRTLTTDPALASIVGQVGAIPPADAAADEAAGLPANADVGLTGLEKVFETKLRGVPGGTLLAGNRQLASAKPIEASDVRTTIVPSLQRSAVTALGPRLGGIAVIKPSTGEIEALAGAAFSGLQPPGSTFKMVTSTAILKAGTAKLTTEFPAETQATLEGVALQNADGESCGGTLIQSFANSCNSVFAPLGAKVGATKLVAAAEDYGFNHDLGIPGAAISTIPAPSQIGDDLAVGSSAIGQGMVQATALQMALVASTIAERGKRPALTLDSDAVHTRKQVVPASVSSDLVKMMTAVVAYGTGQSAQIPGVTVAGKTGTAELKSTQGPCTSDTTDPTDTSACPSTDDASDTTAWFAGFAPASAPKVVVAVQLPGQGKGGDTAAPAAKQVLETALSR